ncbi:hypothetical protein F5X68DRAFT_238636 [Plectosphaerella plurivora]|uniref:G5 domain-containing protein n=1 Tax=Plectosphaerella plurivora TaxID=936078 RepID=A0A9P8VMN4_9PEZI|nr:hypothetical protein F5X68DRAFT_238636 [Plectosphaerella plurivora]
MIPSSIISLVLLVATASFASAGGVRVETIVAEPTKFFETRYVTTETQIKTDFGHTKTVVNDLQILVYTKSVIKAPKIHTVYKTESVAGVPVTKTLTVHETIAVGGVRVKQFHTVYETKTVAGVPINGVQVVYETKTVAGEPVKELHTVYETETVAGEHIKEIQVVYETITVAGLPPTTLETSIVDGPPSKKFRTVYQTQTITQQPDTAPQPLDETGITPNNEEGIEVAVNEKDDTAPTQFAADSSLVTGSRQGLRLFRLEVTPTASTIEREHKRRVYRETNVIGQRNLSTSSRTPRMGG